MYNSEISTVIFHIKFTDEDSSPPICYAVSTGRVISRHGVIYHRLESSYSTTNKMHMLSQIIDSCKTLYMFRTDFPSIIRNSKLRIQQRYVKQLLLPAAIAAGSSSCLTYTMAVYAVLSS